MAREKKCDIMIRFEAAASISDEITLQMATKQNYYDVLGVGRDASFDEIKRAYRRKALENHPDQNPGNREAELRFKLVLEAYKVLADEEKRHGYDALGSAGPRAGRGPGPTTAEERFHRTFSGGPLRSAERAARRGQRLGPDVQVVLEIELAEAAQGATRTIDVKRSDSCDLCHGTGTRRGTRAALCTNCEGRREVVATRGYFREVKTCPVCNGAGYNIDDPCTRCGGRSKVPGVAHLTVVIPEGICDGEWITVAGEGELADIGDPRGNLRVQVKVKQHPFFARRGNDLCCRVPISFPQAALGAEIEVPTLRGPARLSVPSGTQSGAVLRLAGRGMPDRDGKCWGDELVEVIVEVPRFLTTEQEEMLRGIAGAIENGDVSPMRKSFLERLRDEFPMEAGAQGSSTA